MEPSGEFVKDKKPAANNTENNADEENNTDLREDDDQFFSFTQGGGGEASGGQQQQEEEVVTAQLVDTFQESASLEDNRHRASKSYNSLPATFGAQSSAAASAASPSHSRAYSHGAGDGLTFKHQADEFGGDGRMPVMARPAPSMATSSSAAGHPQHGTTTASSAYSSSGSRYEPSFKDQVQEVEGVVAATMISSRHVTAMDSSNNSYGASHYTSGVSSRTGLSKQMTLSLVHEGFPIGLAEEMRNTKSQFPIRFWVVDNSGSMLNADGQRLVQGSGGKSTMVNCSRWDELQRTVAYHAKMAGHLGVKTYFRLLNTRGAYEPQEISVQSTADVQPAIAMIEQTRPEGVTPLTAHLFEIRNRIRDMADSLNQNRQKAVVVLATDGLPSDEFGDSPDHVKEEFENALRELELLPVWVVVRLCTNDVTLLKYYQKLDEMLELNIEVIDDYENEAKELNRFNPWLNYTLPLHRVREMGYHHRVFDLLDERALTKDELLEFLHIVFGSIAFEDAPDIHADFKGFYHFLDDKVLHHEKLEWNPITKTIEKWIDTRKLKLAYGEKKSFSEKMTKKIVGVKGKVTETISDATGKISDTVKSAAAGFHHG